MPTLATAGATLSYQRQGSGPAALFVQGVGLTGRAWSPQTDALAQSYTCIALDNRGIGESQGDTRGLSIDVMARDGLALLSGLGVARAHLVGHSLGGVIVQRMALLAPERVASLMFMCTFAGGRDLARPSARLMWLGALSRLGPRSVRRKAFARLIMPDAYLEREGLEACMTRLEQIFGRSLSDAAPIADVQLSALRAHDERSELSKLAGIASLVLSGRLDPIATHAANNALAQGIGGAVHRVWDDASHALPIQYPEAVNEALSAHFASAPA
jgi:pimeloyl-ACP methyl ester carboxylesterase